MEISEDSSFLAVGFSDSMIKVWSLVPQKLRTMKNADQLNEVPTEAGVCLKKNDKISMFIKTRIKN